MRKRIIIVLMLMVCCATGWAQEAVSDKLSATTQIFLDDLNNRSAKGGAKDSNNDEEQQDKPYADIETIDGRDYMPCFLRLKDNNDTKELEKLGVRVQCRFDKGIITASVPVDNLLKVAELVIVKQVSVASVMTPTTLVARQMTNTDDVLTLTAANSELLSKGYDGTGVLLGIIDTGIDFQHIAFQDKFGNSRIVQAYVYDGSNDHVYEGVALNTLTTDNPNGDHGTHTASTAGGSSVIVYGTEVTVTDNHAEATYGGMAPGASLYLAGLKSLANTYLVNATQKIVEYADAHGMPLVVSNSWGSQDGAHDGLGYFADIYNQYFSDKHPNHIVLFSSGNDAGKCKSGETGGYHLFKDEASATSPLRTILRNKLYSNTDGGFAYTSNFASAWTRQTCSSNLIVNIHVLDNNNGNLLHTYTVNSENGTKNITLNDETSEGIIYYLNKKKEKETKEAGVLKVTFATENGKKQVRLYTADGLVTNSEVKNETANTHKSDYTLALEIYPETGSIPIDIWGYKNGYFINNLTTTSHAWTAGSDDMCASDESTIASAISVGAYVSTNTFTDSDNATHVNADAPTIGDIAYFSSYATEAESPTGLSYPWITAPGSLLAAGVNHYHTGDDSYYGKNNKSYLVVNNGDNPYAMMQGTSMSTPVAAGIVALWLQYAKEQGKALTTSRVKEIMKSKAMTDEYTRSAKASHFGNGKIDALGVFSTDLSNDYYILSDNTDNTAVINNIGGNGTTGETSASVMINQRNLYQDDAWNTLCLPFDVKDSDADNEHTAATGGADGNTFSGTPLEGATVMQLDVENQWAMVNGQWTTVNEGGHQTGIGDDNTLYMNFTNAYEMKAGTPYIVKWANINSVISNPAFSGVNVSSTQAGSIVSKDTKVQFIGTYSPVSLLPNDPSNLFLGTSANGDQQQSTLYYPNAANNSDGNYYVGAFRAYFHLSNDATAREFKLNFSEGEATGITTTTEWRDHDNASAWYDLSGRRLAGRPTAKGIYIHGGRKVVLP